MVLAMALLPATAPWAAEQAYRPRAAGVPVPLEAGPAGGEGAVTILAQGGSGDRAAPFRLGLPGNTGEFLDPDVAFVLSATAAGGRRIVVRWTIADGYYLYRDKFKFTVTKGAGIELESVRIPPGKVKDDPYFGRVEIFHNFVEASIALHRPTAKEATTIMLDVGYQGCAEAGLCYPPITKTVPLMLPASP